MTEELKAPVPSTVDEQEEVAPAFTLVGEQLADTEVMVTGVVMAMLWRLTGWGPGWRLR